MRTFYLIILSSLILNPIYALKYHPELPVVTTGEGEIFSGRFYCFPANVSEFVELLNFDNLYAIVPDGDKVTIRKTEPVEFRIDTLAHKDSGRQYCRLKVKWDGDYIALISRDNINEGEHPLVPVIKANYSDGYRYEFDFTGQKYILDVTSQPGAREDLPDDTCLTLTNTATGESQLISRYRNFDSVEPLLLFAGDLDGDGLPDLIISQSSRNIYDNVTLYLSSTAEENGILSKVSDETIYKEKYIETMDENDMVWEFSPSW